MPVGVPKVPFVYDEEEDAEWVDLYYALYQERLLFLCHALGDELANQLIGLITFLSAEDETFDIFMYINSPGGSIICGLGLFDMMRYSDAHVFTICAGIAASTASFVLSGGEKGERITLPHTRIMIHQPQSLKKGQANDVFEDLDEVRRLRRQLAILYSDRTGQPVNKVCLDLDRDIFMSARGARYYGIVDKVVVHISELVYKHA